MEGRPANCGEQRDAFGFYTCLVDMIDTLLTVCLTLCPIDDNTIYRIVKFLRSLTQHLAVCLAIK
jgi:hypothetical protein